MSRAEVITSSAPSPVGPYSQGITANGLLFIAGQGGFDPSGKLVDGIEKQTVTALKNVEAIVIAAGASVQDIVKVSVFLADLSEFAAMNLVYEKFFGKPYPARTTVQCTLPPGMRIELDAVAATRNAG